MYVRNSQTIKKIMCNSVSCQRIGKRRKNPLNAGILFPYQGEETQKKGNACYRKERKLIVTEKIREV